MPRKHWKGDISVPHFIASGTGRDMYLDPQSSKSCHLDHQESKVVTYHDDESGRTKHLRWWTRLPASAEFLERKKKQRQMALRLSQLPKIGSANIERSQSWSTENARAKMALEPFNPWSIERQEIKNYSLKFKASQTLVPISRAR
jgi:hypothetical protein